MATEKTLFAMPETAIGKSSCSSSSAEGWVGWWWWGGGVVVGPFQPEWIFHTINYGRAGICVSGLLASRAHTHVHRPISRRKQTQQDI